jgi:hypothetical protein
MSSEASLPTPSLLLSSSLSLLTPVTHHSLPITHHSYLLQPSSPHHSFTPSHHSLTPSLTPSLPHSLTPSLPHALSSLLTLSNHHPITHSSSPQLILYSSFTPSPHSPPPHSSFTRRSLFVGRGVGRGVGRRVRRLLLLGLEPHPVRVCGALHVLLVDV